MNNYYLGLDIGTDSVGWAVTNENYELCKFKGKPMWGSALFDAAQDAKERRKFRTARRRLDRRQFRIRLLQELFCDEISKVDSRFYTRLRESALYREDCEVSDGGYIFNDKKLEKEYYKKYPTIHHLIMELIENPQPHDIRLVYLAISWFMAHRGHFLSDISLESIESLDKIDSVYSEFMEASKGCYVNDSGETIEWLPLWNCNNFNELGNILSKRISKSQKLEELKQLLFDGIRITKDDKYKCDREWALKLLCGFKVHTHKLFPNDEDEQDSMPELSLGDADLDAKIEILDEEKSEFILKAKNLYDWALLKNIKGEGKYISNAKVRDFGKHKSDLKKLKELVKKCAKEEIYNKMFNGETSLYSLYINSKCDYDSFKKELNKILGGRCDSNDELKKIYEEINKDLDSGTFLPKQVNGDNRVIPHQLYEYELVKVLENAKTYLEFLNKCDEDGSVYDKIHKIFTFRVPYYVGPLVDKKASQFAWMVRKASGTIRPWNFEKLVDLDESENAFIKRMTNYCQYLPDQEVLPYSSLLYKEFMVLNEINPIKVNSVPISVEAKQKILEYFKNHKRVTRLQIENVLRENNFMQKGDTISGIDNSIKPKFGSRDIKICVSPLKILIGNAIWSLTFWVKASKSTLPNVYRVEILFCKVQLPNIG